MERKTLKAIANIDQLWEAMSRSVMEDPDYFGGIIFRALEDKTDYKSSLEKMNEKEIHILCHLANMALSKILIECINKDAEIT